MSSDPHASIRESFDEIWKWFKSGPLLWQVILVLWLAIAIAGFAQSCGRHRAHKPSPEWPGEYGRGPHRLGTRGFDAYRRPLQ
jgi:hypothetical protein